MFLELLDQALAGIARGHEKELCRVTEALRTEIASLKSQLARTQELPMSSASQLPAADAPPEALPSVADTKNNKNNDNNDSLRMVSSHLLEIPIPEPRGPPLQGSSSGGSTFRDRQSTCSPGRELQVRACCQMGLLLAKPQGIQVVDTDLPGALDQGDQGAREAVPDASTECNRSETKLTAGPSLVVPHSALGAQFEEPDYPFYHEEQTYEQQQQHLSEKSETPVRRTRSKRSSAGSTSSAAPPEDTVQLQLVWKQDLAPANKTVSMRKISIGSRRFHSGSAAELVPADDKVTRCWSCLNSLVMNPGSDKQVAFEIFGLLLLLYDLVWWPAQVFGFSSGSFASPILWLSSAYWTCNLLLSFFVGFTIHNQGLIEMRVSKIAKHYARTWLPIDLPLVLIDWTLNALVWQRDNQAVHFGGGGFLEKVELLRLLHLLRLFKAFGFIKSLVDRIQSESARILVRVVKLLVFIMLINHLIACSWYGLGISDTERDDTWVKANALQEKGALYAYTTALHWSITQFTPASMEVVPKNELERAFTIVVILSAMVIFSSFVSTITNAMNQLGNLGNERNAQLVKLRRFFSEQKVSASLVARISSCIHQSTTLTSVRVHSEDIRILELLPVSLKCDLAQEIFAPTLCAHPFISTWAEYYPSDSKRLFLAAKSFSLGTKHELFHAGQATESMYFLSSGAMVFVRDDQASAGTPEDVGPGQWLAEPAMWLTWKHVGYASSTENCELISLHCETAIRILSHGTGVDSAARRYAKTFAAYFAKHPLHLSDVWADKDVLEAMVSTAFIKDEKDLLHEEVANTGVKDRMEFKTLAALRQHVRKYKTDGKRRKDILEIGSSDSGFSDTDDDSTVGTTQRSVTSPRFFRRASTRLNGLPGMALALRALKGGTSFHRSATLTSY
ncbi:unnamed protein product [Polarella glacialis]|uniref:Cyclic nucleotide-binding domain-containing protein n=1 Tax=Polarella glacialis TaxID=89957 RepID=A0A813J0U9_POLGL|nr:unnamed protein product [Polarella glacialis]